MQDEELCEGMTVQNVKEIWLNREENRQLLERSVLQLKTLADERIVDDFEIQMPD